MGVKKMNNISFHPILPVGVIVAMDIVGGFYMVRILARRQNILPKLSAFARILLITILTAFITARPMLEKRDAEVMLKNLDILFVVDTTFSMNAADSEPRRTRLNAALDDLRTFTRNLSGSNFALIQFDNRSRVLSPFTQDISTVTGLAENITTPKYYDGNGTAVGDSIKDMASLLRSSRKKDKRKTIVFFMSDGEDTRSSDANFSELKGLIDGGAVIGYGTSQGARMKDGYSGYVYDYETHEDAITRLDEQNLKQIADAMGIDYVYSNGKNNLDFTIAKISRYARMVSGIDHNYISYQDLYYYLSFPLAILLLFEFMAFLYRGRL
jgi:Ca-activated chloride channel family protein